MLRRLAVTAVVCGAVAGALGSAAPVEGPRALSGSVVVVPQDPGPSGAPGGQLKVRGIIANETAQAAPTLVVTVRLPAGSAPDFTVHSFPLNCTADSVGGTWTATCTFQAGLPSGRTATALVPVRIAPNASGVLVGGRVSVSSPGDPSVNDSQPFTIKVNG